MVESEHDELSKKAKAHSVFVRLVLPPYTIHFKSPSYLQPHTLDLLDKKVCKETLKRTAQDVNVREAIGADYKYWIELAVLLRAAIPSLERRSFTIWDPTSVDYESTSGALIAGHYPTLWRDLERLNDLVSISRNVLTIGISAQDLAAEHAVDNEIFRIINCCVRVTARGYDGDAGTGEEEKWQWVVNAYKKLLITSLQFLNNLVARNEKRKLMLWIALFDNSSEAGAPLAEHERLAEREDIPMPRPEPPLTRNDLLLAYGTDGHSHLSPIEMKEALPIDANQGFKPYPVQTENGMSKLEPNGYVYWTKRARDLVINDFHLAHQRSPTFAEIHLNLPRYWRPGAQHWESQHQIYEEALAKYRHDMAAYEMQQHSKASQGTHRPPSISKEDASQQQADQVEQKLKHLEAQLAERHRTEAVAAPDFEPPIPNLDGSDFSSEPKMSRADDSRMIFTAEAGAQILESGKAELMKRLEGYDDTSIDAQNGLPPSRHPDGVNTRPVRTVNGQPMEKTRSMSRSPPGYRSEGQELRIAGRRMPDTVSRWRGASDGDAGYVEESMDEDEEDESEDGDEDDEDYPGSTEDGRGLLTDVPLILGPSEIEVLPMLIMSAIVPRLDGHNTESEIAHNTQDRDHPSNMATLLTHLLLSQTSGRNLLRELLIFVAAWDLREEELYFKFMVKIMEAILTNGLMPYAYHAFRDRSRSKDIISPAQAVIMKLLTCIFRGRVDTAKNAVSSAGQQETGVGTPSPASIASSLAPNKVDLHILNFIFTEFRQHIIPQTCALIFLQGQIHKGRASPDDFPLNLWDMERMYEGVYQYLEFFAVLTEDQTAHAAKLKGEKDSNANAEADDHAPKNASWKTILAEWEMASELVTLLRELEGGIPKMGLQSATQPHQLPPMQQAPTRTESGSPSAHPSPTMPPPQRSMSADAAIGGTLTSTLASGPVAVERPFELESPPHPALPPLPPQPIAASSSYPTLESDAPLAYPEDKAAAPPLSSHDIPQEQDEPSDFEWRNLKKLTVLVLSSLIWKNRAVQDQVRKYGGLEALVGCCRPDEHNPYIREHAIMCLRFAVEGNEENSDIIRGMANRQRQARLRQDTQTPPSKASKATEVRNVTLGPMQDVPREVLDTNGYETFMDGKGQVGLRRKEPQVPNPHQALTSTFLPAAPLAAPVHGPPPPPPPPPSTSLAAAASSALSALQHDLGLLSASTASGSVPGKRGSPTAAQLTKMTAEKAAELMQSALRDLPLGDKLVTNRQKAEALARLDRAFESTEQALGKTLDNKGKKG